MTKQAAQVKATHSFTLKQITETYQLVKREWKCVKIKSQFADKKAPCLSITTKKRRRWASRMAGK